MKKRLSAFVFWLLFAHVLLSVACRAPTIKTQETNTTTHQASGENDSSTPLGWKRYNFDQPLTFSLVLPNEPEHQSSTLDGTETKQVYISQSDSGVYGVTYIDDLPAVASRSTESGNEFFFKTFIKDFAAKWQSAGQDKGVTSRFGVIKDGRVTVSGLEGLEKDFSIGARQGRARLVRIGQAGFCVIAVWGQNASSAERDGFFDSVKILSEGR